MKIDFKSALLGLVVGAGAILLTGAGENSVPVNVPRYQITGAGDSFFGVVDTTTGKVWLGRATPVGASSLSDNFFDKKNGR